MDKIGLISDTHGNSRLLKEAADFLVQHKKISRFYHCGDDYNDADLLLDFNLPLLRVPGIFESLYKEKLVPVIQNDEAEGWQISLVHDINDLTAEVQRQADIILYGHSHDYAVEKKGGKIFINPGHLKDLYHKNRPASFGILAITQKAASIEIFNLSRTVLLDVEFSVEDL